MIIISFICCPIILMCKALLIQNVKKATTIIRRFKCRHPIFHDAHVRVEDYRKVAISGTHVYNAFPVTTSSAVSRAASRRRDFCIRYTLFHPPPNVYIYHTKSSLSDCRTSLTPTMSCMWGNQYSKQSQILVSVRCRPIYVLLLYCQRGFR